MSSLIHNTDDDDEIKKWKKIIIRYIPLALIGGITIIFTLNQLSYGYFNSYIPGIYFVGIGVAFLYLIRYFDIVEDIPPYLKYLDCIHPNQNDFVRDYITKNTDNFNSVDIIQYSGSTLNDFLTELLTQKRSSKIRLLLFHPFYLREGEERQFQTKRIVVTIESFARYIRNPKDLLPNSNQILEIRLYHEIASLRGICFDQDLIVVGWYTYILEGKTIHIRGHHNPIIVKFPGTPDGKILHQFFSKQFDQLWNNSKDITEELTQNDEFKKMFTPERLNLMNIK